jgi:hypothetical protein
MNTRLLCICLFFTLPALGQNNQALKDSATSNKSGNIKHRISIGGSVGCGIPMEGYGLNSANSSSKYLIGYADPGVSFNINCSFRITRHFGLMVEGGGAINTLNKKFYNEAGDGIIGGTGGTYYIANLMAGPFFSIPFKNGDVFETRFLIGSMTLNKSTIFLAYSDAFQPASIATIEGFSNTGLCAELGAKFKFRITNHFYLTADISYIQSGAYDLYYDYSVLMWSPGPGGAPLGPLGILNTSLGVEFKL